MKFANYFLPLLAVALLVVSGCDSAAGVDPGVAKLKDMFTDATGALEGVTDETSAATAADKLKDVTSNLDSLGLDKLTGVSKTAKDTAVSGFKSTIEGMVGKLYGLPGVEAVLKPAIEGLMSKLGG